MIRKQRYRSSHQVLADRLTEWAVKYAERMTGSERDMVGETILIIESVDQRDGSRADGVRDRTG